MNAKTCTVRIRIKQDEPTHAGGVAFSVYPTLGDARIECVTPQGDVFELKGVRAVSFKASDDETHDEPIELNVELLAKIGACIRLIPSELNVELLAKIERLDDRPLPLPEGYIVTACRGCAKPLMSTNLRVADCCPCNSGRGINHGLIPEQSCTCVICDPEQTGSTRYPPEKYYSPSFTP